MRGYFINGREIKPEDVPKPKQCESCVHDDDPEQRVLCILTRADQMKEPEFACYMYGPKGKRRRKQ